MAYIKVDHSKFEAAADAVSNYYTFLGTQMHQLQTEKYQQLGEAWEGTDAKNFLTKLSAADDKGSVHALMRSALKSYSEYLRFAAKKYKDAQIAAINRANRLP